MNKKLEIAQLDIPLSDTECWLKYHRHRWVYDMSRLLDAQKISWSPWCHGPYQHRVSASQLDHSTAAEDSGYIYLDHAISHTETTDVAIVRGEIKNIIHENTDSSVQGDIELKLTAFVILYFQKFTGVISFVTQDTNIYRIHLRPMVCLSSDNSDIAKLLKRIYKKNDITISGAAHQELHESLAS
jgi:hypothetical protein